MANYSTLKTAVADVVKTNGSQAITGANLQSVLLSIINSVGGGYIFKGVATPSTSAGTPDQNVFYLAGAGTYANFGTSVIVPPTNIAVFKYNGSWTCEQVMVENGGVFDISAFKAVGGTLATYANLAAALGTGGANVPQSLRKGGMSVKFVCSSDNKYVQYRLISDSFNTTESNWQGVDDVPTAGSDNLVKSGGVYMFRGIPEALKNKTFLERNKRVNNYEIVVANGWSAQTMEVGNANTIFAKVSIPSTAVSAISFWDEQMQYIDGVLGDGKHEVSEYQCDVPVGAKYYIVCTYNDYLSQSEYYTDYEYFSLFNKIPYNCSSINDVEIQDKYSRVIAVMNGGHIRLKNFDSRNVDQESISNLRGKRISILGDSISSYQGYTPQGYKNFYFDARENWNGNVNDTYWKKAINELELVLGSNCSWSGSVCCGNGLDNVSAQSGCSDKRISDLGLGGTPDIILVYIGINDFASGYDLGDYSSNDDTPSNGLKKLYSEALSLTLGKIINSYPMARVFVGTLMPASTIKSTFPTGRQDGSGVYHTLSDWNSVIVDLASGYGCEVVDFSTCGITYGNLNSVTFEGLHPNVLGHSMMANKFIKTLITKF